MPNAVEVLAEIQRLASELCTYSLEELDKVRSQVDAAQHALRAATLVLDAQPTAQG